MKPISPAQLAEGLREWQQSSSVLELGAEIAKGLALSVEVDGITHQVPLRFDFDAFTPEMTLRCIALGGGDPSRLSAVFLAVRANLELQLGEDALTAIITTLHAFLNGDTSSFSVDEEGGGSPVPARPAPLSPAPLEVMSSG